MGDYTLAVSLCSSKLFTTKMTNIKFLSYYFDKKSKSASEVKKNCVVVIMKQ